MIGNPCKWFVTGNDEKEFTYEGGNLLYHFQPHDCGLSNTMEMNIVFHAISEEHAKDILQRMLLFGLACMDKYDNYYLNTPYHKICKTHKQKDYNNLLNNIDSWKFKLAPTNQFFVIGWASNDVL